MVQVWIRKLGQTFALRHLYLLDDLPALGKSFAFTSSFFITYPAQLSIFQITHVTALEVTYCINLVDIVKTHPMLTQTVSGTFRKLPTGWDSPKTHKPSSPWWRKNCEPPLLHHYHCCCDCCLLAPSPGLPPSTDPTWHHSSVPATPASNFLTIRQPYAAC